MEVTFGYFDLTWERVPLWQPIHCFSLVKLLICPSEFMEAETRGMFTSFAHIWLREMSCPETEQVRLPVTTLILFLLLSYAYYIQDWLSAILIDYRVSFAVRAQERPVTSGY